MLFCILKRKYDYTLKVPELSCPVWWLISLWKFGADLTNKTFHSLNFSSNNSNLTRNKAVICPSIPIRFVHVQCISQNCKGRQAAGSISKLFLFVYFWGESSISFFLCQNIRIGIPSPCNYFYRKVSLITFFIPKI